MNSGGALFASFAAIENISLCSGDIEQAGSVFFASPVKAIA